MMKLKEQWREEKERQDVRGEQGQSDRLKQKCRENKNALLLSLILCICLTPQSGRKSPSLSYKRAVTHSSALHSLATEGR